MGPAMLVSLFLSIGSPSAPREACTVKIEPSGRDGYTETRTCKGSIHVRQRWDRLLWGNQGEPRIEPKTPR